MEDKKGSVIYIAAEENREQFKKALMSLNPQGVEDLYIHTGPVPKDVVVQVDAYANQIKPVLIIVDTLIRVVNVKDTNDYAEMSKAMEPFQEIALKNKCHIMLIHHAGKIEREQGDGVLGSTAIFASIETLLFLERRKDQKNYLRTMQRYGESLDPYLLEFEKKTKSLTLGGNALEMHKKSVEDRIVDFIKKNPGATQADIYESVEGHRNSLIAALRQLVTVGDVLRGGTGGKGKAYTYRIPPF